MEDKRLNTNIYQIEDDLNELRRSIIGIPIDFVFNLDEMGCSEFQDARERIVIVPIDYQLSSAPYPATRLEKHVTCLACVNPSGLVC